MRILRRGMSGTDVMEIQSLLQRLGYAPGPVDGLFGTQTQRAVIALQRGFGLTPDGIIGAKYLARSRTLSCGVRYLYHPAGRHALHRVAQRYYTNLALLIAANPGLDPYNLRIGQQVTVPYGIDVVEYTDRLYIRGAGTRHPRPEGTLSVHRNGRCGQERTRPQPLLSASGNRPESGVLQRRAPRA